MTEQLPDTTDPRVHTTFTHEGWTINVTTTYDDTVPTNYDCYTSAQVRAWERDDWYFCGCIVTASREGVQLGEASLWGIECNLFTYTDEDDNVIGQGWVGPSKEVVDDLIAEAIEDAKDNLRRLAAFALDSLEG